jgi:precorrin-6B methylase 2
VTPTDHPQPPSMADLPSPGPLLQLGLGFWASKTLLSAVELDVFTTLGSAELDADTLRERLGLHPRGVHDFLDALVALQILDRAGDEPRATYRNTPASAAFLDRSQPTYIGGILEMANDRLYPYWGDLTDALRTGTPQNELKHTGRSLWDALAAEPPRLATFMRATAGISLGDFHTLAAHFDFDRHDQVLDVGGGGGDLAIILAAQHPHLRCTTLDTPSVTAIATRAVADAGLDQRISTVAGDMFDGPLPHADVITMCNVVHGWGLEDKQHLIAAAYDALPDGGALIIVENLIDDARRHNAFGLLMSLNMLIETEAGFDTTANQLRAWTSNAGFTRLDIHPLPGASAAIATKGTGTDNWKHP